MSHGRDDIQVAVVTALPVERTAVQLLIDDLVDEHVPGDPNHYQSGRLPGKGHDQTHRVVVAMQTEDGTRNAAAVVTNLVRSFPRLRCVVMCGIAGGVPAPDAPHRHVRLGDIVVATDGVVDYDHVRTVDSRSHLRRSVSGLSRELLRADRELEVKELADDWPWRSLLSGRAGRRLPAGYSRPPDSTDVLLWRGKRTDHPRRAASGHVPGWPRVHRCAIGSADRLVRDAVKRDELAHRHGVRAVEMESSGLAVGADLHGTHWFVVRGVADYCDDASKNDRWHRYASLVAAAYVRALLAECRPFLDDREWSATAGHRTGEGNRLTSLARIVDVLLTVPHMQDDYHRRAVMALLPLHIRTMIADNVNGRLHVIAMVQTCFDADDGRQSLLGALRLSLPPSTDLERVIETIETHWPD